MIEFKHPKPKSKSKLKSLVNEAIKSQEIFIGDLTKNDAYYVSDLLESRGFKTEIETDSDALGHLVDSHDWKCVHFIKDTDR